MESDGKAPKGRKKFETSFFLPRQRSNSVGRACKSLALLKQPALAVKAQLVV